MKLLMMLFVLAGMLVATTPTAAEVSFEKFDDGYEISIGGQRVASYVFDDGGVTRRPYFANIENLAGSQVTRHHPPREGVDLTDHSTMHPGIWMAFGDISGNDFWRNRQGVKTKVLSAEGGETGQMVVRNTYELADGTTMTENCTIHIQPIDENTYRLLWEAVFLPTEAVYFGDQEEMGLGVRVATEMNVRDQQGTIINADGAHDEAGVWGKQSDWAAYQATIDGKTQGVLIVPENKRTWFHARDYGLLLANQFGRKAFEGGEPARLEVKPDQPLALRYGIVIYGGDDADSVDLKSLAAGVQKGWGEVGR